MNIFWVAKINIISISLLLTSAISSPVLASSMIRQNTMKENFVRSSFLVASEIQLGKYERISFDSCSNMQTYFNSLYAKKTNEKIKFHDFADSKMIAGLRDWDSKASLDKSYYCAGYFTKTTPLGTKVCQAFIAAEPRGKPNSPDRNENIAPNDYDPPNKMYSRAYVFRYGLGFSYEYEFRAREYKECVWRG